jgi:CRP-like cAMP-binding protein
MNTFVNESSNSMEFWNTTTGANGNGQGILNTLPRAELALLRPRLEFFRLQPHQVIQEADEAIKHAYFIENGLLSILNVQADEKNVEVGTLGSGGFAGLPIIDGFAISPHRTVSHANGAAQRIDVDHLQELLPKCPQLLAGLHRYQQHFMLQSMQMAACNALHEVEQRLARWLLMGHDLLGPEMPVTQEVLGQLLGTRRSSVTVAAGLLQKTGALTCARGRITILDLDKLKTAACTCYPLIRQRLETWNIQPQAAA